MTRAWARYKSRKCAVYLPQDILEEIQVEAARLSKGVLSKVVLLAWELAREEVRQMPGRVA